MKEIHATIVEVGWNLGGSVQLLEESSIIM